MEQNTSNNALGQQSQGDPTTSPPVQGTNPPSQGDQGNASIEELQRKLAELERDNRKYRQERKQQEEAAALATQKQLEDQGKFKELAEQSQARVHELEPYQERYNQLATQLSAQIKTQIKDWPPEVKAFDPGEDAPIEQRLDWIEKSKPIVEKLQGKGREAGNGPNPPHVAGSQATRKQQKEEYREQRMKRGGYVL